MGSRAERPDHRFQDATAVCSGTLEATRPESSSSISGSTGNIEQDKSHATPEDYAGHITRPRTTLSSHPLSPGGPASSSRSPMFNTALYDPSSDSIHVMPHSQQTTLDSQFRDFKDRLNIVKSQRPASWNPERPHSLNITLRNHGSGQETSSEERYETNLRIRASSLKLGHISGKAFDLMAPPPGKRRSCKPTMPSSMDVELAHSIDADPSEALTTQIASSILQERYGVRGTGATPLKVQEAVRRCLQDVSRTVQSEHPQWDLPKYHTGDVRLSGTGSRSSSRSTESRQTRTGGPVTEEEDDPFPYDRRNDRSTHHDIGGKEAEEATGENRTGSDDSSQGYPCPFRRRNPISFNVRDHENCAKRPFSNLFELKRHIRTYHRTNREPHHCPRCKKGFGTEIALADHLTVPLEEMCEPRLATPAPVAGEGITEDMDQILANTNKRQSWEEVWRLLFPQDASVLDPEFLPVVEGFEAEQEFDNSSDELKADLCESLKKLLPDQAGDPLFFQVLGGQLSLVFEQHRAKVNRRCRNNVINGNHKTFLDSNKAKVSRFSVASHHVVQAAGQRSSFIPEKARRSRTPSVLPRTTVSPASSVYSQRSSSSYSASNSRAPTRSSSLSTTGGMQVESPRLPFRDWVQGVKFNSELVSPGQRDSGLALPCEGCNSEPCGCASYADQLSAFMTPATGAARPSLTPYGMMSRGDSEGDIDWAAHYGDQLLSAGGLRTGPGSDGKTKLVHDGRLEEGAEA